MPWWIRIRCTVIHDGIGGTTPVQSGPVRVPHGHGDAVWLGWIVRFALACGCLWLRCPWVVAGKAGVATSGCVKRAGRLSRSFQDRVWDLVRLAPPSRTPASGFPNSTAELSRQFRATLLLSSGTQKQPLSPPEQRLTRIPAYLCDLETTVGRLWWPAGRPKPPGSAMEPPANRTRDAAPVRPVDRPIGALPVARHRAARRPAARRTVPFAVREYLVGSESEETTGRQCRSCAQTPDIPGRISIRSKSSSTSPSLVARRCPPRRTMTSGGGSQPAMRLCGEMTMNNQVPQHLPCIPLRWATS